MKLLPETMRKAERALWPTALAIIMEEVDREIDEAARLLSGALPLYSPLGEYKESAEAWLNRHRGNSGEEW
jgi:hypothetical protein